MAKIRSFNGFSGQKQQLFPPKNQHSNLDGGTPKSRTGEGDAHFSEKIQWGARNKSGGGGGYKNKNRGGAMPPAGDAPDCNAT